MIKTISITDNEILKHLEKQGNQSLYMCQLIKNDMSNDPRVSMLSRYFFDILTMWDKSNEND